MSDRRRKVKRAEGSVLHSGAGEVEGQPSGTESVKGSARGGAPQRAEPLQVLEAALPEELLRVLPLDTNRFK